MSRCTTSSSNLRPMRRLMANRVFWGLVTAWRLAGWPTSTSPSLVKATIEGVVRSPSLFSITRGLPPSMMATHELVVPRSMPITFAMGLLRQTSLAKGVWYRRSSWVRSTAIQVHNRRLRDDHPRRPQQPAVELVARLYHPDHRVWLRGARFLRQHRLVARRIERLAQRLDHRDPELLQRLGEQLQRGLLPLPQALRVRLIGVLHGQLQAVHHGQQLGREFLQAIAVGGLDVALRALAHVVELGDRTQILLPVVPGALLSRTERLLQALELDQLRGRFGQHGSRLAARILPVPSSLFGIHQRNLLKTNSYQPIRESQWANRHARARKKPSWAGR